jgi:hypothetical protein
VDSRQGKLRLRVAFDRKSGVLEARHGVTHVAPVVDGIPGELTAVRIGVARGALQARHLEARLAALRLMALAAEKGGVFTFQRKSGKPMGLAVEEWRIEAGRTVTGGTIRPRRPRRELPCVRILMAVAAAFVRNRPMEIVVLVAFVARQRCMSSDQGKPRHLVIEDRGDAVLLPSAGAVATFTFAPHLHVLESIMVRILMTVLAAAERQAFEEANFCNIRGPDFRAPGRNRGRLTRRGAVVALFTGNLAVHASQWKWRTRMVEPRRRLPRDGDVAITAVSSQLILVRVAVAG